MQPPLTLAELSKLEIYAFANCASLMGAVDRKARAPYVESYGNEFDLVARLGVLAPGRGPGAVRIGGERFVRQNTWGHLLNAHYLHAMEQEWRSGTLHGGLRPLPGNTARTPRLFGYFGGASPERRVAPAAKPHSTVPETEPVMRSAAA